MNQPGTHKLTEAMDGQQPADASSAAESGAPEPTPREIAEETSLRLVREVVPRLLGIAHRPHDAKHTQSRKSRTEGVRIEADTGQGRRTLTGEEQVRRAKEHSETSLSFRGLEV